MAGLKSLVTSTYLDKLTVAYRAPVVYAIGIHNIFTITGGPVQIVKLFGHAITAIDPLAVGTTFRIAVSGVNVNATTVVASVANTLIVSPLDDAGVDPIVPNVAANSIPFERLVAVPGNIALTVAVGPTVGMVAFYCVYYRMNPAANIL